MRTRGRAGEHGRRGRIKQADAEISGIAYGNIGDWVENCPAFVEHDTGVLELVNYFDEDRSPETPDSARTYADPTGPRACRPRVTERDVSVPETVGV